MSHERVQNIVLDRIEKQLTRIADALEKEKPGVTVKGLTIPVLDKQLRCMILYGADREEIERHLNNYPPEERRRR